MATHTPKTGVVVHTPRNCAVVVRDAGEEEESSECPLIVMIQPPSLPKITWDGEIVTLDWSADGS